MAIDSRGFVYVADRDNHRMQKFTPEGQFVSSFGTKGSQPGQLYHPAGIAIDDHDLVYVSDENDFVSVFNANGDYVCRIQKKCEVKDHNVDRIPTLGVCTMTSLNRPIRLLKTRLINAIQTVRVFRRLINIFAGLINIFAGCDNFFGVILMMILKALL